MLPAKLRLLTLEREMSPSAVALPDVPPPMVLTTVTAPPEPLAVLKLRLLNSPVLLKSVELRLIAPVPRVNVRGACNSVLIGLATPLLSVNSPFPPLVSITTGVLSACVNTFPMLSLDVVAMRTPVVRPPMLVVPSVLRFARISVVTAEVTSSE